MKRVASIATAFVLLLALASTSMGAIGWSGNIWPVNGTGYTSNDNIGVYVQVWKDGCTDAAPDAACPDIEAYLYYRCSGTADAFIEVPMVYNVDVGNNDEFTGTIPSGTGCSEIEFYVMVVDVTDNDTQYPTDQNGNYPNFFLPITAVTQQDVTVKFQICISEGSTGGVCLTGSAPELTNWSMPGVSMSQPCPGVSPNLYEVSVMFPVGSNPNVQYKYQKDDCSAWDCDPNHGFTIDDSSAFQTLAVDAWCGGIVDCPGCASPVEESTWGTVKSLYR
jgi:hypothetical protein